MVGDDEDNEYDQDTEAPDLNRIPKRIVLSHSDFASKLRLPYARCYYTVQGKTYRDTHIVLLDAMRKRFKAAVPQATSDEVDEPADIMAHSGETA